MRVEPVSPEVLVARVAALVVERPRTDGALRVLVDGHPSTHPETLADLLVEPLRVAGRPTARVSVRDFLRPASVRLEHGHEDPDALLDEWIDVGALNREVLSAVGPAGEGRYLPSLRDPVTSRSTRAGYVEALPGLVVLLDGSLSLGRGLDVDLTVHLALQGATVARRTPPADAWTLPAYARYQGEVAPERTADVVVRVDDARRPAWVTQG
ncbi:nucleoside/nucleotide kinase family protein [Oerskovia enterophila]|uniref:Uridine kinase n=1 Tax=Oerskovia enterophila TaxID=43678 RepID=A0ABX2Y2E9_9CELL|nr:uridine kinase [Oerskovia enterophila]OCI30724.1 uridine kinase [Oerskovia enterophila]